jgi:predicted anti-sigma-YlaC factor YlaD
MSCETQELTCKELVELITDYLEAALPRADALRFEEHLAICPGCRNYLDQMRTTVSTLGALREDSIPPKVKENLMQIFRNWKA